MSIRPELPDGIPNAEILERRHQRYRYVQTAAFVGVVVLDVYFLAVFFADFGRHLSTSVTVGWASIGVGHWLWISMQHLFSDAVRLEQASEEDLGRYRRSEVTEAVSELLEPYRQREQPTIYIRRSAEPGAECIDKWFFNFLRPLNAIYITSILLHIMRRDELKAILAHELGHFYHYTHPLRRGDFFVFLLMGLFVAQTGWAFGAESFWFSLIWGPPIYFFAMVVFGSSMIYLARAQEYLCDLFGARHTSKISMVNALLQLGKGLEVSERVFEQTLGRISEDRELPIEALPLINAIVDRSLPQRLLEVGEEVTYLDQAFASEEMAELRQKLTEDQEKEKSRQLEQLFEQYKNKPGYQVVDWNDFDFDIRDLRVNEVEYPHLIKRLIVEADQQLLNFTFDNVKDAKDDEHPTLRQRILFLEKNLPPNRANDSQHLVEPPSRSD